MKIALIGKYGEQEIVPGPERIARDLHSELKGRNLNIVFIEYFFSEYKNSSVINKIFGKQIISDNQIIRLGLLRFLILLFREQFDIIHIINHQSFLIFLFIIRPFIRSKIFTTFHGLVKQEIPLSKLWRKRFVVDLWIEKLLVKKSELMIFPSNLLLNLFNNYYKISHKEYRIIPNGVNKIFYDRGNSFPLVVNSVKIVFYNGFNDSINRGFEELLELLRNVNINIELFVIGNRTEPNPNSKINLIFVNAMSQIELCEFLRDKHFIIKSQAIDTFSLFVAECMLLGLIPIISKNIGIKEVIKDKVNGFIYSGNSPQELAELFNDIFNGRYDLQKNSLNAKKIFEQLNWNNIVTKYLSAYNSIL
jgi:glycosyltransferase involved in cell wall biosynthesis